MIIHDVLQRSPEWYAVKCGKIGASSMSDVLAKGRGNSESKTRKGYMVRLLAERLSGMPQETYCNSAMQWGIDTEPQAKEAYEADTLTAIQEVGFIELSDFVGCSPDGLVGDDGLVEIKCPNTTTHIQYLLDNRMPPEYIDQVQTQLWVCNRVWCDFVSFDPRLTVRPYWTIRVERDEDKIKEIKIGTELFISEMFELEERIKKGL